MGWAARRTEADRLAEREREADFRAGVRDGAEVRRLATLYRSETDGRRAVGLHSALARAVKAMLQANGTRP